MYRISPSPFILVGAIMVLLPFMSSVYHLSEDNHYCALISGCIASLFILMHKSGTSYSFSSTDIWVALTFCWLFLSSFFFNERIVSNENIALWLSATVFYIVGRIKKAHNTSIYIAIALCGFSQHLYGWLQYIGAFSSHYEFFSITGSFSNPAFLAATIGLSEWAIFRFTCHLYLHKSPIAFSLLLAAGISMFIMLIIIQSRAAWIALFLSSIRFFFNLTKRRAILWIAIISLLLALLPLYQLKQKSANGRLFIWTVGCSLIRESPFAGSGGESFAAKYMPARADYLTAHPESIFSEHTSSSIRAFNEPLRIICEYGFFGLFLFGGVFYHSQKNKRHRYFQAMLTFLCIFALFSYPSEMPALLLPGAFILGVLSSNRPVFRISSATTTKIRPILIALTVGIGITASAQYYKVLCINRLLKNHIDSSDYKELDRYASGGWYHRNYILGYSKQIYNKGDYEKAVPYLRRATQLNPIPDIYIDLGNSLMYRKEDKEAEICFIKAIDIAPLRVLPYYHLFRLYAENGNTTKARQTGHLILSKDFRKESSTLDEIRRHVRNYMQQLQPP